MCRTWPLRHLARLVAQLAPVAIVLVLLLPGPLWIRVMGALGGSLVGLFYSFVFLYEATEGRATKAGYPHGTLHEVRNERQTERALQRAAADARTRLTVGSPAAVGTGPDRPRGIAVSEACSGLLAGS
jgi:hypothetical protein